MSKVLFLVNHEVVIYNFRLELVERLLEEGHEVIISSPDGEKIKELVSMGCIHEKVNINGHGLNPFEELSLYKHYVKLLKKTKPDVVFSYTIKPNIYGGLACQRTKTPYIINITGLGTAVENEGILQKIIIPLYKLAFRKAKKIFFQNNDNQQFFVERGIGIGKHELLPGSGVNLKRYIPAEYPSDESIRFAFISRVMEEKGVEQYLDAAKVIREKYPNTEFHVCGLREAEYHGKLDEYAMAGIVKDHGMINDVKGFLAEIHCLVHPTYYPEGLSNILLESSACARPIITTDRAGCREIIDDTVNGFICKQKNSEDVIKQIEKFLACSWEKRREMGLAGRRKVEMEFDRTIVVDAYMKELHLITEEQK